MMRATARSPAIFLPFVYGQLYNPRQGKIAHSSRPLRFQHSLGIRSVKPVTQSLTAFSLR